MARAGEAGEAGGSGGPPSPSNKERLQQAMKEAARKQQWVEQLLEELEAAKTDQDQHMELYQFQNKGKEPKHKRPLPPPDKTQPPHEQTDKYSIP